MVAITVTKTTDMPMPRATPRSLEHPRYGQFPRFCARTILLTNMAETKTSKILIRNLPVEIVFNY
jgi:hypothetical protein